MPNMVSYVSNTRTFSIIGNEYIVGGSFNILLNSINTKIYTPLSCVHDNTSGLHYIYLDFSGALRSYLEPVSEFILVARIYFNASTQEGIVYYKFYNDTNIFLEQTRYYSGFDARFTNGSINTRPGIFITDDTKVSITAQNRCRILYKNNSSDWSWTTGSLSYFFTSNGNLVYNSGLALAAIQSNYFITYFVFITSDKDYPIHIVIGQREDSSLSLCKQNNNLNTLDLANISIKDYKLLYKLYVQNGTNPQLYEVEDVRLLRDSFYQSLVTSTPISDTITTSTDEEAVEKTSTDKAITPSNIPSIMASPGIIGGTTPDVGNFTTLNVSVSVNSAGIKTDTTTPSDLVITTGASKTLVLTSPVYEDLRVAANDVTLPGVNAPQWGIYRNDGIVPDAANSLLFDGSNDYATIAHSDTNSNLSIEFWINLSNNTGSFFHQGTIFETYINNRDLAFSLSNLSQEWNTNLNPGQTYHIVYTIAPGSTTTDVNVYINSVLRGSRTFTGVFSLVPGNIIVGKSEANTRYFNGKLDDVIFYNKVLTLAQIQSRYNSGNGVDTFPSGITEATDVLAEYLFEDMTGANYDNIASTITTYGYLAPTGSIQSTGLIEVGTTAPSIGVAGLIFPPNVKSEVFFNVQLPHSYLMGGDIDAHVHWIHIEDGDDFNIVWGLEYLWVSIHGTSTNTSTITTVCNLVDGPHRHQMSKIAFDNTMIDGTGKGVSSMLMCRLFRDGANPLDTFEYNAYFMEFDFHFPVDTMGSREVYAK